jgi:hypothetical protein
MSGYTPDPSWPSIVELAIELWGQPTRRAPNELRFGAKESKSVRTDKNVWFDNETNEGGGYRDLHMLARRVPPPANDARPRTNGHGPRLPHEQDIARLYDYRDADGSLVLQVVRTLSGSPRFRQRAPDGRWSVAHIPNHDRLLYRLPGLIHSGAETVWICEGEKDADRLHGEGLIATTNIGGAEKWRADYASHFAGKPVVVLQDNDAPGAKHAAQVANALRGTAASVRVLLLPDLPPKGDVSDWLDAGHDVEELRELAEAQPEVGPAAPPPSRIVTGATFMSSLVVPDWLIDGIVQRSRLYSCTSNTGHGKTAVWLYNACMIQAGRPIVNMEVTKGFVVYLAGENPEDLKARMVGMAQAFSLRAEDMPYVMPHSFPLSDSEIDALIAEINALGVPITAIIGDTAAAFYPGDDENDNVQAGAYGRSFRRFIAECTGHPAVIPLCHPIKRAAADNLLPRGGGGFLNEMDANLTLWASDAREKTEMHWQGKIRGPDFAPLTYDLRPVPTGLLDKHGRPFMTVVAEPISSEAAAHAAKQTRADENAVLYWLNQRPDISLRELAREAGWVNDAGIPNFSKVRRHLQQLTTDRLVRVFRGKYLLTETGKIELKQRPED